MLIWTMSLKNMLILRRIFTSSRTIFCTFIKLGRVFLNLLSQMKFCKIFVIITVSISVTEIF